MKCLVCRDVDLIWGGDDDGLNEDGDIEIITNLSCSECGAQVFVHHGSRSNLPDWVEALDIEELNLH